MASEMFEWEKVKFALPTGLNDRMPRVPPRGLLISICNTIK